MPKKEKKRKESHQISKSIYQVASYKTNIQTSVVLLCTHSEIADIGFKKGFSFLKVSVTTKLNKKFNQEKSSQTSKRTKQQK